jgi:ABC-type sugar transport system ATPase subunit
MSGVTFEHIQKEFGNFIAVNDLNLNVDDKVFLVFVGPSGCGKTDVGPTNDQGLPT